MERLTDICTLSAFVYLMLATLFKICPCGYGNLSYSMMEEVPINTFIADLKTCIKTNTTEESVFGFLTTDQRYEELFHIADDTGLLFTSKTIDREIICLHRATCVLELQVYVNGTKMVSIKNATFLLKLMISTTIVQFSLCLLSQSISRKTMQSGNLLTFQIIVQTIVTTAC